MITETSHATSRLIRSTSDKKLGGVAGGLGAHFSVDPILFRIGFAVTTLFSGAGALAYLAMLAFVPTDSGEHSPIGARPAAA